MSSSSSTTMPIGLQIAHGGYDTRGESFDEPSHKEKARFFFFPHLFQPFFVCFVLSFTVFCFYSRPQKHQWVCCVFLSNLPHSSPSKPFLCKCALIFTTKTFNPHPHLCLHQSKPIAAITARSDPPLNNRSTNSPCNTNTSIQPSHGVCHHHPTCISLPIATICSFLAIDGFAD